MVKNRAQHIRELLGEAVISGKAVFQGREFFDMLRDIQQGILAGGSAKSIVQRLNDLDSVAGGMMRFDLAKKSAPTNVLFIGAGFSHKWGTVWVFINPNLGRLTSSEVSTQMAHMQAYIEHEYVHMTQQGRRMDAGYDAPSKVYSGMGFPSESPLSQYRQERQAKTPDVPVLFARHMSVGISDPPVGSWYMAQPDEIMAWAVQLASLVDQQRRKNPATAEYLSRIILQDAHQVFTRLAPNRVDTPAFNRFRKYMVEYLISHLDYSPHSAGQMVTQVFQNIRRRLA